MASNTDCSAPPKAYSYLRFSTPDQMQGDSFRRQTQLARTWATQHGLTLSEASYQDLGVSAYRGANAETGMLGQFLQAVREGVVERGSYLLIESLDRLSRNKARKAIRVLEDICSEDITVVTLADGKTYTDKSLDDDPMSFMWAFMVAMRANEESAMKAGRLKASWEHKRSQAALRPLTARAPAWLQLDTEVREFRVLEERAAVVRRIFDLAADGVGQHLTAQTLNREGVATFGSSAVWSRGYVKKILENPAVVGTLVPHTVEHEAGRKTRKAQSPVEGYYPAIVSPEVFQRVQAQRVGTRASVLGSVEPRNLLASLARCPACGGSMTRVTKGSKAKSGKPYLVCTKAKAGGGCTYKAVPLATVESAVVKDADWLLGTIPSGDEGLDDKLTRLEAAIEVLRDTIGNLLDALSVGGPSPATTQRLREVEAEMLQAEQEREALLDRAAAASPGALTKATEDLRVLLGAGSTSDDPPSDDPPSDDLLAGLDRGNANAALRRLFERIVVDYANGSLDFHWKHGGRSSIMYAWSE